MIEVHWTTLLFGAMAVGSFVFILTIVIIAAGANRLGDDHDE